MHKIFPEWAFFAANQKPANRICQLDPARGPDVHHEA